MESSPLPENQNQTQKLDISRENTDSIVFSVIQKFKQRADFGLQKYGQTMDRNDLSTTQWIQHTQEQTKGRKWLKGLLTECSLFLLQNSIEIRPQVPSLRKIYT